MMLLRVPEQHKTCVITVRAERPESSASAITASSCGGRINWKTSLEASTNDPRVGPFPLRGMSYGTCERCAAKYVHHDT